MIINTLRLHPFAGIVDGSFAFAPGLNVVLGPNEAGKSTMLKALMSGLFESTDYKKKHWNEQLQQFLPRRGGDVFRVTLECDRGGQRYQIQKSWGGDKRCQLVLPTGHSVNTSGDADRQIEAILELKQGTWKNVLISGQAALPASMVDLKAGGEEVADLAQVLRKSAFDTDGVSIETLDSSINGQLKDASGRWDMNADRPENGRGLENPWKNGVGSLLKAWYRHEELLAEHTSVETYERELDAVNKRIQELTAERNELDDFIQEAGPIISAATEMVGLTRGMEDAAKREKALREIQTDWPGHERELVQLIQTQQTLTARLELVDKEREQASRYQQTQGKRDTLRNARNAHQELRKLEEAFESVRHLSDEIFADLHREVSRRDQLTAAMAAGKLQVRLTAKTPIEVTVQSGLQEPATHSVRNNEPLSFAADGLAVLNTSEWTIEVESGDGGFAEVQQNYADTTGKIDELLTMIGATTLEEALTRKAEFEEAKANLNRKKQALVTFLNGETFESLESVLGADIDVPKRTLEEIDEERFCGRSQRGKFEERQTELTKQIEAWTEEFTSVDEILDQILAVRQEKKSWEEQLATLPEVSMSPEDLPAFKARFETNRLRVQQIKEEDLPTAKNRQGQLSAKEPERSTHELKELIADADAVLNSERNRLQALQRVAEVFQQLKESLDSGTLDPWMSSLRKTVDDLTNGRYQNVDFDDATAQLSSGVVLSHDLLSMGTRASVGLALRLSMAAHFLDGLNGFLVLDDPMVDLDEERRTLAADVLKHFASDKQVIVFTCHPAHAALLTETPIILNRLK